MTVCMIMQKDDPYIKVFSALSGVRMMFCILSKFLLQQSGKTVLH